jgi:hypothetical protein
MRTESKTLASSPSVENHARSRISADAAKRRGVVLEPPKPLREPKPHEVKAYRFTDTPKLGINPMNQYATPVGTYWYPAYDKDDEKAYREGQVEFGGGRAYVIEAVVDTRRIVVLDDVKEADFERYMLRLFKLVSKYKGRENLTSKPRLVFDEAVNRAKRDAMSAGSKREYWGRALWYALNNISHLLSGARRSKDLARSGTVIFNRLSQQLDIDGFLNWSDWHKQKGAPDKRYPIIHPLEPRQLVLFDNTPVVEYQIVPSRTTAPPPSAPPSEPTDEALLTKSRPKLDQLALSPDVLVRLGVADNTATTPETLARLTNDAEDRVRAVAAGNKYTPQEALRKLIKNGASYGVLLAIAGNKGASPKTLSLLATSVLAGTLDSDDKLRIFRAAINQKSFPALAFSKLMPVKKLRPQIAKHPRTPTALLEILAQDEDPAVRKAVTSNSKAPVAILQLLRKDEDDTTAYDALYALERAAASSTTPSDLEQLAGDEDGGVRLAVAENLDAPPAVLERLADDKDRGVRIAVLKNPNTPPAALERFAADDDDRLRRLAARHPNTPPAVLERLASDEDSGLRYAAGANPATPLAALDRLAGDDDEFVRRAVSEHRNTPRATLERLAGDEDEYVRLAARKRLGLSASYSDWSGEPWVHYSKLPKLGINPKQFHFDPAGIYLFPASFDTAGDWSSYQYKFIVELKPGLRVLDLSQIPDDKARAFAEECLAHAGIEPSPKTASIGNVDRAWEYLQTAFARRPALWNKALRAMGYDAVFDDTGAIHSAETQLLVLDPRKIRVVRREERTGSGFKEATEVMRQLVDLLKKYGSVTTTPFKRDRVGWGREMGLVGRAEVKNQDRYADFKVTIANRDGRPAAVHVSLSYSQPSLNYGVGAEFDLAKKRWGNNDLKRLERDLDHLFSQSVAASTISAKKKITRQDAKRMERDAKKHKNWKKKWVEVTQQPKKSPKGAWVGRATFEWLTGTEKGEKRSRPITLGDAAALTIRGGKLIVRPKGGKEYEYGDEESRKAAEAEQKRKQGKSPIDGLETVADLKKELLDNFETSLEMVDKFVRRERKRAKTSTSARLDAAVQQLSSLPLPTPVLLALEQAAGLVTAR